MQSRPEDTAARALFISRAGADAEFAAVIGGILETAGYAVTLQQWDFANKSFVAQMHAALAGGARVVALLSPEYLRSEYCQAEWQNAIADDPLNTKSRLILLRVAECDPIGLLRGLAYWDLVPIRDNRMLLEQVVHDAVSQERGRDAAIGPYWRSPRTIVDAEAIRPVPSFSGREEELAAVSAALANDGSIAMIHGLGGIGKSSVAREYAWRHRDDYAVVWWLNAQTEDGIIEGLLRLGSLLARGLDQIPDRHAAAQQVVTSVLTGFSKPVLLIFDNLEDERLLRSWQPRTNSRVLVTSRNAAWGADVAAISLETWSVETATGYLRRESRRSDLTEADASAIAETLGSLPLALSHAAASLRAMRMMTPQRYLQRIGEHLKNAPRDVEYPISVFATFSASIAQAEHQAAGAAAVLCFAASFAFDAIPEDLFTQPLDRYSEDLRPVLPGGDEALDLRSAVADELRLDAALGALDRLSVLAFAQRSRAYSLHRLVQLAGNDLVGAAARGWRECAVQVVDSAFPEVEFATWPQCERVLPHARAALDALSKDSALLPAGRLAYRCACYLQQRGEYPTAELVANRGLAIQERAIGSDHPDVARSLNNLGIVYWQQGRFAEAESVHLRELAIEETALGAGHPELARSLNNLANVYRDQARYAQAESLYARALAIWETALGPDHPLVAIGLNNLANVYHDQARYAEEEPLHMRAVAIREKALGPDDLQIAFSLTNLANLYQLQGRYAEAEPLNLRSLAIREGALGPDHSHVAMSLTVLALMCASQGRYAEAERHHRRALAIREKVFGPDRPDVGQSLNNLADLYCLQGRYAEAEPLLTRALSIRERTLGSDHPLTKVTCEALDTLRLGKPEYT
jgi:tetratricopeptide (TPR) repeat protein